MNILEIIKNIGETVTTIVTALIIIITFIKQLYSNNSIKYFFRTTIPVFFKGDIDINGKKVRFFKGVKQHKNKNKAIIKAISNDFEMEEVLVLDKKALFDIFSKSEAFKTVKIRSK